MFLQELVCVSSGVSLYVFVQEFVCVLVQDLVVCLLFQELRATCEELQELKINVCIVGAQVSLSATQEIT